MVSVMNKNIGIGFVFLFVLIAGGGFVVWQQGWFLASDTVVLQEGLPPAPTGYNTLDEDPVVVAELPADFQQKQKEAFAEVLKTIEEHPDSFVAWFNAGSIKSLFGDYTGAEEAWLYATTLAPNQARTYMNLADLYTNKVKDYQKAEWALRTAIEVQGGELERTRAYRELASLYRFSLPEQKAQAITVLRDGIERLDDNGELLALAGFWAWQDGLLDDAIRFYERYLEKNPGQEQAEKDLKAIRLEKTRLTP